MSTTPETSETRTSDFLRDAIRQDLAEGKFQHVPYATAPDYYALYCEDPDRINVEVAPRS